MMAESENGKRSIDGMTISHPISEIICPKCRFKVTEDQCAKRKILSTCGHFFHRQCFRCDACKNEILFRQTSLGFRMVNENLLCLECYQLSFHPACAGCGGVLRERAYELDDRLWHRECITCARCLHGMPHGEYRRLNGVPFCTDCAYMAVLEGSTPNALPPSTVSSVSAPSPVPSLPPSIPSSAILSPNPSQSPVNSPSP